VVASSLIKEQFYGCADIGIVDGTTIGPLRVKKLKELSIR
jgi:hypothetical protein